MEDSPPPIASLQNTDQPTMILGGLVVAIERPEHVVTLGPDITGSQPADDQGAGFEGFIESYGRQEAAGCWVVCGWVSRASMSLENWDVAIVFERGSASAEAHVAFYERDDLGGRGVGFVVLLLTTQRRLGRIQRLQLQHLQPPVEIIPAGGVRELSDRAIIECAEGMLATGIAHPNIGLIRTLLAKRFLGEGYIDTYGYHSPSVGWFVCGWISNDWIAQGRDRIEAVAHFDGGDCSGPIVLNYFDREDIRGKGLGVVLHLPTMEGALGRLLTLTLSVGGAVVGMRPAGLVETLPGDMTASNFHALIADSDPGPAREQLRDLVARAAYDGRDTVTGLPDRVHLELDEVITCAPDSVMLFGWMQAKPGTIKAIRLRSAEHIYPVDIENDFLWIDRHDVIEAIGRELGFDDPHLGFVGRVPTPHGIGDDMYLEIETASGDIGFKAIPRSRLDGIAAIKRILGGVETQYTDVDTAYDRVFGPAIGALNARRLQTPPRVQALQLGKPVRAPRHSVIVPLHSRIDFMEIQMALFALRGIGKDVEIIYVLDDPPRAREAQFLAASLYERFRVPFRLLCLSRNVGFAPANNIGLQAAQGQFICFMNSDVFPTNGDWLDRLAAHLEADARLGVVGPLLLFEDDSVQHLGMVFKNLPQFGNWAFPQHKRKGLRIPPVAGLAREAAITGACMMLRRETILDCGGFDEAFIIGDFEDTDLCFRLGERGLGAAIYFDVRMHHLERKSQASSAELWRSNMTLYNAWVHQRRWARAIRRQQEPT